MAGTTRLELATSGVTVLTARARGVASTASVYVVKRTEAHPEATNGYKVGDSGRRSAGTSAGTTDLTVNHLGAKDDVRAITWRVLGVDSCHGVSTCGNLRGASAIGAGPAKSQS